MEFQTGNLEPGLFYISLDHAEAQRETAVEHYRMYH